MAQYVAVRALHRSANVRVVQADNAVQSVTVDATGGTYTLTFEGQETGAIAFDATAAEVVTALEALSTIEDGDVGVTGGPGDSGGTSPYLVSFRGELGDGDVSTLEADDTNLTGGDSSATVAVESPGVEGGRKVRLTTDEDVVIDLDRQTNRRELNRHSSIGQYIVSAANDNVDTVALPDNS